MVKYWLDIPLADTVCRKFVLKKIMKTMDSVTALLTNSVLRNFRFSWP
jgi:hypothetical protein